MLSFKPETLYEWDAFGTKAILKFTDPLCVGFFTQEEAENKGLHFISEKKGHLLIGNYLRMDWLIAEETGIVIDAKFQAFGHPGLIILGEAACEIMIGKCYTKSYDISFESLTNYLQDPSDNTALPQNCISCFGIVIDALDTLAESCGEIPGVPKNFISSDSMDVPEILPEPVTDEEWQQLSKENKLSLINSILEAQIMPYIRMDGGGLSILGIVENKVTISYQGACTGCYSAVGSTLNSITEILQGYVYSNIEVEVEEDSLSF